MLRSSLTRPLLRRPFSIHAATRNVQRPPIAGEPQKNKDEASTATRHDGPTLHAEEFSSLRPDAQSAPAPESSSSTTDNPTSSSTSSTSSFSSLSPSEQPREPLSNYDLELVKKRIREWTEQATIALRNRADDFTGQAKATFSQLGSHLNKVTGYEEIEALKRGVVEQEEKIYIARQAAKEAKLAYEEAAAQRSKSQREVNDLLQRKSSWTDADVSRFTTLVRQDHLYDQEEARAKEAVIATEDAVEREFSELLRKILARYHEEQVWSDKIRSASTYGSLVALGLNMLVFIMAIVVVEPWKRRRLAQTFERKIEELSRENEERVGRSMEAIGEQMRWQGEMIASLKEELARMVDVAPILPLPAAVEPKAEAEEAEHPIVIVQSVPQPSRRQWELAAISAGAFVAGILTTAIFGR
ncbi:hypothetical protein CVT26_009375 [Gymnopilus dilepis]|uniref:Sensitive to high expression protein 9, mitochondrial n=1 Tax=Gymnopilus dilepis TaxID=231916 RepID=A0A409VK17_9AGAR|nr:hypothetical protein CVT26_009375 [Gymnopilus dilepis]